MGGRAWLYVQSIAQDGAAVESDGQLQGWQHDADGSHTQYTVDDRRLFFCYQVLGFHPSMFYVLTLQVERLNEMAMNRCQLMKHQSILYHKFLTHKGTMFSYSDTPCF